MSNPIEELLREALPFLENYATMLRRKQNQPTLEATVRDLTERSRTALMNQQKDQP